MIAALLTFHLLLPAATVDLAAGRFDNTVPGAHQTVLLPRRNLLTNASFEWDAEVGNRGVQDGLGFAWGLWGADDAYGVYHDRSVPTFDPDAIEGARSQKIVLMAAGETPLQLSQDVFGLNPEKVYTISVYARLDDPQAAELWLSTMYMAGDGQWSSEEEGEPVATLVEAVTVRGAGSLAPLFPGIPESPLFGKLVMCPRCWCPRFCGLDERSKLS